MFDEAGDPVPRANVQIIAANRKLNAGAASSAVTNDRGEYHAYNLPPGKYRIAVSYTAPVEQMRVNMKAAAGVYATTFYPASAPAPARVKGSIHTIGGPPPALFGCTCIR